MHVLVSSVFVVLRFNLHDLSRSAWKLSYLKSLRKVRHLGFVWANRLDCAIGIEHFVLPIREAPFDLPVSKLDDLNTIWVASLCRVRFAKMVDFDSLFRDELLNVPIGKSNSFLPLW